MAPETNWDSLSRLDLCAAESGGYSCAIWCLQLTPRQLCTAVGSTLDPLDSQARLVRHDPKQSAVEHVGILQLACDDCLLARSATNHESTLLYGSMVVWRVDQLMVKAPNARQSTALPELYK